MNGNDVKPVKRYFSYIVDAVRTANQEAIESIRIDDSRDFILTDIVGVATSTSYQVQFRDSGTGRHWSENLVNSVNCIGAVGSASNPFILPVPRRIKANSVVEYRIKDTSASANTIQISLNGYKIYFPEKPVAWEEEKKFFYIYTYDASKGTGSAVEENIRISSAHHFVVCGITGNFAGGWTPTVRIRDSGTGEFWSDKAVNYNNLLGTAQYPYVLAKPRFLKAGTTVYFEVSLPGSDLTGQICLYGYEVPVR